MLKALSETSDKPAGFMIPCPSLKTGSNSIMSSDLNAYQVNFNLKFKKINIEIIFFSKIKDKL